MTLYVNCMGLLKEWLFESTKMSQKEFLGKANEIEAS